MARDWGKVRIDFWHDEKIVTCSSPAKMFALYLLTSAHTNAIGLFRLPVAYMAADTGMQKRELESAIAELREIGFMVCCERVPWVYLPNYLKHNSPENANVWRKCVKELESVPAEITSVCKVADTLAEIGSEKRMRSGNSGVKDDELADLQPYRNRIETVSVGLSLVKSTVAQGCRPNLAEPEPKPNQTEPSHSAAPKRAGLDVPDWIPPEPWAGFVEMRRRAKHELTDRAAKLVFNALAKLRDSGHDPGEVLDQSTLNGWRDVFPLRAGTPMKIPKNRVGFVDLPPEPIPAIPHENRE